MIQKHFRVKSKNEAEEIHVCLCTFQNATHNDPTIIFSHGFTVDGVESHRLFYETAEIFVDHGLSCILFDYRGCGYSSGSFKEFSPSREIEDLLEVYKFVIKEPSVPKGTLGLLGQSHGSYISVLAASKMFLLKAICLWGASASPLKRYKKNFEKLPKYNGLFVLEKGFLLSPAFLDNMAKHNAIQAIREISCPIAFVHAGDDKKVPVEEGKQAYNAVQTDKWFELIEGGNHSYKRQPELQKRAILFSLEWFCKYLLQV